MRYVIAVMMLAVMTAQGAKLNVVWPVGDGHDSYRIERRESNGVKPSGALYLGKSVPRVYEDATNSVPVAHNLCKWIEGEATPTARTEAENDTYDAYVTEASNAVYEAEIAVLCSTNAYRDVILGTYSALTNFSDISITGDGFAGIMVKAKAQINDSSGDVKSDKIAAILMAKTCFVEYLKPAGIEGQKLQDCIIYVLTH